MDVVKFQARLREFVEARDWGQFHTPKNLAMALSVEASELAEIFQWMTEEQSRLSPSSNDFAHVREEIADVMIYLLRISDVLGIDVSEAVEAKIAANARKYPVDRSRGSVAKRQQ